MKRLSLLFASVAFGLAAAAQLPALIGDSLDRYIAKGLKDWDVPALAIVIVKDGRVIWEKGYGVEDVASGKSVTPASLFMIASNSKLFTGTSLAQLDHNKVFSLDSAYTGYFPGYALYDPQATALLTTRDLLCHRIGTKTFQGDFTFWNSMLGSDEVLRRMRYLKPGKPFRQDFGYCNSCFLAAAQIIPKFTGKTWNAYVKDSILGPLDMRSTYTSLREVPDTHAIVRPYTTSFTGTLQPIALDRWDNLGPAASIISNVSDLAHWLEFQLDSGRYEGRQVMPYPVLAETRRMNTIVSSQRASGKPIHYIGYGLGLFQCDYNGFQVYWHTGGAGGMLSNVCFVPEKKLGIAILTSNDNQGLFEALRYQILDAFLGVSNAPDRSAASLAVFRKNSKKELADIAALKSRVKGATPPLALAAYEGHYTHPLYGSIDIAAKGKRLWIRFNSHADLGAWLDYMDNGEWLLRYNNILYGINATRFVTDGNRVVSVQTTQNEFVEQDPYTFVKEK